MDVYNGVLFVGTYDNSTFYKDVPGRGERLKPHMGAKLYVTADGTHFELLAKNFFDGDYFNYGIRSFAATPDGLYIGSANDWYGTEVWKLMMPNSGKGEQLDGVRTSTGRPSNQRSILSG